MPFLTSLIYFIFRVATCFSNTLHLPYLYLNSVNQQLAQNYPPLGCYAASRDKLYRINQRNAHFLNDILSFNFDVFYMFRTLGFIFRKYLYMQLWNGVFYMHRYKQSCRQNSVFETYRRHQSQELKYYIKYVHFVGLCCIIILQCTLQKNIKYWEFLTCVSEQTMVPETLVINYHYGMIDITKKSSSNQLRGGSLKSSSDKLISS